MAEITAFRGYRFRVQDPGEAAALICPPYDVISAAEREALLARHPHNVVRLELPQGDEDRYARAAFLYREWKEQGILARKEVPALYVYGQRYETESGPQERLGVLAALKVEPYESGVVLPHEQTFPKHKEDRLRLLSAARAQFSPIFGLYSAPGAEVRARLERCTREAPQAAALDAEGVEHRLWVAADPEFASWYAEVLRERQVFIADGHHRYETALRFREHAGSPVFDCVMTYLVEMDDPGLVLLPTHRLLPSLPHSARSAWIRLRRHFEFEDVAPDEAFNLRHHQIGLLEAGGEAARLTLQDPHVLDELDREHSPAWRDLDVAILHRLVFDEILRVAPETEIVYTRDPLEAQERVLSGEFEMAFLLPPPRVDDLKLVAGAGDRMPQKSTYFWPKAVTGLVIYGE